LTTKTTEELELMKKDAISSENFDLANKISEEQKSRLSIDDKIKELYIFAIEAKSHGQSKIPVHIFPAK
jgi:hypothetical protein